MDCGNVLTSDAADTEERLFGTAELADERAAGDQDLDRETSI